MIQILYKQGYSKKRIARDLGISINTVRKYVGTEEQPAYSPRAAQPMKLDPYRNYIKKRLKDAEPHWVPATVIFNEIRQLGYTGGISRLREYMHAHKPQVKEENIIRFETDPGKQMQVDWAEFRKGQNRLAAFIATLGYSRSTYVEFVTNEKLPTLLQCHENAFDYFGGVPFEVLYDNMKTVITERNYYGDGKHRLQAGFWDFSKHYSFIPRVCRPYRAQTKGKVERFIHYLKYSFYYPLLGQLKPSGLLLDVATANQKVLAWLNTTANKRTHGTTGEVPFERLNEERKSLQSIPLSYCGVSSKSKTAGGQKIFFQHGVFDVNENSIQHDLSIYENIAKEGAA